MSIKPQYWKTTIQETEEVLQNIKQGSVEVICESPGGNNVYMVKYNVNPKVHSANFSSACGANDLSCFYDKSAKGHIPTLMLTGCIHGAEFEGTAALLNLINLIESGIYFNGNRNDTLLELLKKVNLIIIPMLNPDGRNHVPFDTVVGLSYEKLRYYNQGTWKDGSLCDWPDCKKIHPIKDAVDYLGGYYNDDGVNLMHDNFFAPMAEETKAFLKNTEKYCPDVSVLLHGGTNCPGNFMKTCFMPLDLQEQAVEIEHRFANRCNKEKLSCFERGIYSTEKTFSANSFNLCSAAVHTCGGLCVTYESNQGLIATDEELGFKSVIMDYDDIYKQHIVLFEELLAYLIERKGRVILK